MQPAETQSEEVQDVAALATPEIEQDSQATNWREANRIIKEQKAANERLIREKEELALEMRQFLQGIQKPQAEEEDEEIDVYAPDFGRKLDRVVERAIEKTHAKLEQKRMSDPAYLEEQARKRYPDFDSVVTSENIDVIIKSNPLMHKAISSSGAPLDAAYEFIKSSAAFQSKQGASSITQKLVSEERQKLAANNSKPKSAASIPRSTAMSAVSGFGRLSKEQAAEINRETNRILRGR